MAKPILLTVSPGQDVAQDILMIGSAQPLPLWATSETWTAPAPIPPGGDWEGSLNPYGEAAYFSVTAQPNRTLSIAVTALDENQSPSEVKAQPVVGIWNSTDPQGTPPPAFTSSPFNTGFSAVSRLDAQILGPATFLIGISDVRGDGRPDYRYHAQVLYGDSVTPSRVGTTGSPVTIHGYGFHQGLSVVSGTVPVPMLAFGADYLLLAAPAQADGAQSFTVSDPATGAYSTMTNVLTYGAAPTDAIVLLLGSNPLTPVGTQATNPVIVRILSSDGVTPVAGASIGWSASNSAGLSVCGGASSCSAATDDSGFALTWVTPAATGSSSVTATLAPGVYSPPQSVQATVVANSSAQDIGVLSPYVYLLQGSSLNLPVTARVVSTGTPQSGVTVNFLLDQGTAVLSQASAVTDQNGYATTTASVSQFSSEVQISACVAPNNSPCQSFFANLVLPSMVGLQPVSGGAQAVVQGQAFAPVALRVTDSASPPHPLRGAQVAFQATLLRPASNPIMMGRDCGASSSGQAVVLEVVQSTAITDANGMAAFLPSVGPLTGPIQISLTATVGNSTPMQYTLASLPASAGGAQPGNRLRRFTPETPVRVLGDSALPRGQSPSD